MSDNDTKTVETAVGHFAGGYLCSQAILMAFASRVGIEPGTAARIAASFGGGMARMGLTCGAVTGAMMVIGLKSGHETPTQEFKKEKTYELVRDFMEEFQKRNGTVSCRELLGVDLNTPQGLEKAAKEGMFETLCPKFVRDAAEVLEKVLADED